MFNCVIAFFRQVIILQTTCLKAAGQDLLRNMPRLQADIPAEGAGDSIDSEPEFNVQR